jgi:hypothetical protein
VPSKRPPTAKPPAPRTLRLYVFDCGLLNITTEGVQRYHVTPAEVGETRMSVPCFLIAHPQGTLMWDLGVIPDGNIDARGQGGRASVNVTAPAVERRPVSPRRAHVASGADNEANVQQSGASRSTIEAYLLEDEGGALDRARFRLRMSFVTLGLKVLCRPSRHVCVCVRRTEPGSSAPRNAVSARIVSGVFRMTACICQQVSPAATD